MKLLTALVCTILSAGLYAQTVGSSSCPVGFTCTPTVAPMPTPPVVTQAQTKTACVKPSSFYAAGTSYNSASAPNIAGIVGIGTPLTCSDTSFQVYSYTEHNLVPVGTGSSRTFKDTISTGFAMPLKQVGPIDIFVFGNIGVSTTTSTATNNATTGVAGAYGGMAVFPLWKNTAWRGLIAAQKVASNNVYSFLIGRNF